MKQFMQQLNLPVKEISGQRVITIKQVAKLHKTSKNTIAKNFQRNSNFFIEGVDYYRISEMREGMDKKSIPPTLHFTESGYLMLVKPLTDDTAWAVQRQLVNGYFKAAMLEKILAYLPDQTQKVIFYRSLGLTQSETGKLLDITRDIVQEIERKLLPLGYQRPNQSGQRTKLDICHA